MCISESIKHQIEVDAISKTTPRIQTRRDRVKEENEAEEKRETRKGKKNDLNERCEKQRTKRR